MKPGQRAAISTARNQPTRATQDQANAAKRVLGRWRADPVAFAHEALGIRLWGRQCEVLRALAECDRVAVKSGHKTGKSKVAGVAAWWAMITGVPESRVIMTSASGRQVHEVLWREITTIYRKAPFKLGPPPFETPSGGVRFADGRQILGLSTDDPERMAGFSGPSILYIVDEASGVPDALFDAIEGNRAGGAKILLLSNPTQTVGYFYEAFHAKRHFWQCVTISSEETPNATAADAATHIKGLATRQWIQERKDEWGTASPAYQVRVKGEFPTQSSDCVISVGMVDASRKRAEETARVELAHDSVHVLTRTQGPLTIGVDVARFGSDETVICGVRGTHMMALRVVHGADVVAVVAHVVHALNDWSLPKIPEDEKPTINVDGIGVGAGVVDLLRSNYRDRLRVRDINVSERADDEEHYANLRTQVWFGIRDWIAAGGMLPADAKLEGELVAARYSFDARGRFKVESKDDMRKRLGRSPDRADAVGLAVYRRKLVKLRRNEPREQPTEATALGRLL